MARNFRTIALCLAALLGAANSLEAASSPQLEEAVKKYYAGRTDEAIGMIRPLAKAGDADAQYLLGNILYTLANSGQGNTLEDPATWYRMAARQNSAPANYALGVIHNNRFLRSHRDEDARLAQSYLQRAAELGEPKASSALEKLAGYRKTERNTVSLSYTNADFSAEREPGKALREPARKQSRPASANASADDRLAAFATSGDPIADAEKLRELLDRLQNGENPGEAADAATLSGLLGGFESVEKLVSDVVRLLGHIEEASKLDTAPGSN